MAIVGWYINAYCVLNGRRTCIRIDYIIMPWENNFLSQPSAFILFYELRSFTYTNDDDERWQRGDKTPADMNGFISRNT